jgi:hypothetical protein
MYMVEPFHWDLDISPAPEQAIRRQVRQDANRWPRYSAVMNGLKAVQVVKTDDAAAVMKHLKSTPIIGSVRAQRKSPCRWAHGATCISCRSGARRRQAEVGLLQCEGDYPGG